MMADFKRWSNDYAKLIFSVQEPEEQLKCARNFVKMQYAIAKLIEEKRKVPQDDLISEIQNSELTINDMIIVLSGLIIAGYKSTSHAIGNTLKILLEKPGNWQAICLMFASGNRDESHYKDAQTFDIQRFESKVSDHLAFGHGIHRCIGSNLALLQARIAFELLSARLQNLRITPNQQLEYIPTLITRGFTNLIVEWDTSL